jgi:hypothetical protein
VPLKEKKMTTATFQSEPKTKSKPQDMSKLVENAVFDALGKPENLTHVKTSNVWGDSWRVTIYCKKEKSLIFTEEITDSFFIIASPGGEIINSNPEIERKYQ